MMPKVSIIVPVYNVEKYIERCARSLFNQTIDNIEFIFIDDCTPDGSIDLLNRIVEEEQSLINEKNWAIVIYRMPYNSGQAAVRRRGLQLAKGDYVIHCDSDDWIEEDMISEMWHLAFKDDLDVVVCDYNHVKSHETIRYKGMKSQQGAECFFHEVFSIGSSWAVWNKLFRRSLYNRIVFPKVGMNMGEDMAIVLQLLYSCNSVGYVNKPFYNYCDNTASITNTRTTKGVITNYLQWVANICLLESFFRDKGVLSEVNRKLSFLFCFAADDILRKMKDLTRKSSLLIILEVGTKELWCPDVSLYGKMQYGRYLGRKLFSYIKCKLH